MLEALLAIVGLAAGFGANTVVTKKRIGSAQDEAKKELAKSQERIR